MRDAHQSLLATRVRTHDLLKVAPATARLAAGLFSLECWGGATFDVAMRFLNEDPWERLARAARRRSPTSCSRCCCAAPTPSATRTTPTTWCEKFVHEAAAAGVDVFRVFDSLNWTKGMRSAFEAVREETRSPRPPSATPATSPTRARTKYPLALLRRAGQGARADGRPHARASRTWPGCCKPFAAAQLVQALKRGGRRCPSTSTPTTPSGVQAAASLEASRGRRRRRRRRASALSGLTAQPNLKSIVAAMLERQRRDTGLDSERLLAFSDYWEAVRDSTTRPSRSGLKAAPESLPPRDPGRPVLQPARRRRPVWASSTGWRSCKQHVRRR